MLRLTSVPGGFQNGCSGFTVEGRPLPRRHALDMPFWICIGLTALCVQGLCRSSRDTTPCALARIAVNTR